MNEIINKIKSIILTHKSEGVDFQSESDDELRFLFRNHLYVATIKENLIVNVVVCFLLDGKPYKISDDLAKTLSDDLELEQKGFTIGINGFLHVTWPLDVSEIESRVVDVLDRSNDILERLKEIVDKAKAQTEQKNTHKDNKGNKSVKAVLISAFENKKWKFKVDEQGSRFKLSSGFSTKEYKDSDDDNYCRIMIVHDGESEVIFYSPFVYNLFDVKKDMPEGIVQPDTEDSIEEKITDEILVLREGKLALLNLHMTSTRKFLTMTYDAMDGEVRYELRMTLDKNHSFSEEQTYRGVSVIKETLDEFNSNFIEGVFDDTIELSVFSRQLFKLKKPDAIKDIVNKMSSNNKGLAIDELTEEQKDKLANQMALMAQAMLNEKASVQ